MQMQTACRVTTYHAILCGAHLSLHLRLLGLKVGSSTCEIELHTGDGKLFYRSPVSSIILQTKYDSYNLQKKKEKKNCGYAGGKGALHLRIGYLKMFTQTQKKDNVFKRDGRCKHSHKQLEIHKFTREPSM